jgi:hypothetical protein
MNSNEHPRTVRSIFKWLGIAASLGLVLLLAPEAARAQANIEFLDSDTGSTLDQTTNAIGAAGTDPLQVMVPAGEINRFLTVAVVTSKLQSGGPGDAQTVTAVFDPGGYNIPLSEEDLLPDDLTAMSVTTQDGGSRLTLFYLFIPNTVIGGTYNIVVTSPLNARIIAIQYLLSGVESPDPFGDLLGVNNTNGSDNGTVTTSGENAQILNIIGGQSDSSFTNFVANCSPPFTGTGCADANEGGETTVPLSGNLRNAEIQGYLILNPATTQPAGFTANNNASWVTLRIGITPAAVNSVGLVDFEASRYSDRVASAPGTLLQWRTGQESDNLGFNVYRDAGNGTRINVTPGLVAGSALFGRFALEAGHSYAVWDPAGTSESTYWLEDVDVQGTKTLHGPYRTTAKAGPAPVVKGSPTLDKLRPSTGIEPSHRYTGSFGVLRGKGGAGGAGGGATATSVASQSSVKLSVREAGWYRVTQADLAAIGLNTSSLNPRTFKLYADGVELPILVTGEADGRFDASDVIEFFGSGVDTATTDTRVYWLAYGSGNGKRAKVSNATAQNGAALPYSTTVELKERFIYFSFLANGDKENFFGQLLVAPTPQHLTLRGVNPAGTTARVDVALQGINTVAHTVGVSLNGQPIGQLSFAGLEAKSASFTVSHGLLVEGDNVVTLTPLGGSTDRSLVDYIRITYSHTPVADQNEAFYPSATRSAIQVGGFTSPQIRAVDVTNAAAVQEFVGTVSGNTGNHSLSLVTPFGSRQLYFFTPDRVLSPASIELNVPSTWSARTNAADVVILTHGDFAGAVAPLVQLRQSQGYSVAVVDVEDIYDEFAFGYHTPYAIRSFLNQAATWSRAPRFVTVVGDASYDARDYFGVGDFDFVPTKLIDTFYIEAASDDWHADRNGDGIPEIAIGRLPVRTVGEAEAVVAKIVAYETSSAPNPTALFVADTNDINNYEAGAQQIQALLPSSYTSLQVFRGVVGTDAARQQTLAAFNDGRGIVHYTGHGSIDLWRANVLLANDAATFTNAPQLSLVTISNCLNGYFTSPLLPGLGESLVKAPNGGAIAVWSSSSGTGASGQQTMMLEFYRQLFSGQNLTIGEAVLRAKAAGAGDVRLSWTLVGDPATRLR